MCSGGRRSCRGRGMVRDRGVRVGPSDYTVRIRSIELEDAAVGGRSGAEGQATVLRRYTPRLRRIRFNRRSLKRFTS